ncbi:MAG: hypothetical protein LBQ70_00735 [Prevotellaceae bacterium]|nr:hypothetical protein [Prevotellaceae bacterium]
MRFNNLKRKFDAVKYTLFGSGLFGLGVEGHIMSVSMPLSQLLTVNMEAFTQV